MNIKRSNFSADFQIRRDEMFSTSGLRMFKISAVECIK